MAETGLIFIHGVMGSGKTTELLHERYLYISHGFNPLLLKPEKDKRHAGGIVRSRDGLEAQANVVKRNCNILEVYREQIQSSDIVLVDEAQFLTANQVAQLVKIYQRYDKLIKAYGLKTDFKQDFFRGSSELLRWCTDSIQLRGLCYCGDIATINTRVNIDTGEIIRAGKQTMIDKDLKKIQYVAMCHHCIEREEITEREKALIMKYKK